MIKIEKGIPLTPALGQGNTKYPFSEMEIGDSILVSKDQALRARLAAHAHKKRHPGWDYASRKVESGLRIWRTT